MFARFVALAALLAAAYGQNVWGVTSNNELVYFGGNLGISMGWWTLVGQPFVDPGHYKPLIQVGDIDTKNNVFYGIAVDTRRNFGVEVFGVNTTTGQFAYEQQVPFLINFNYVNTPGLDWIRGTDDILVYGRTGASNFEILRLTLGTNTTKSVASFSTLELIQSVDAYDPENMILWVQTTFNNIDQLVGFNAQTGAQTANVSDPFSIQSLNYDGVNKVLYALGTPNGDTTPIITLDTLTGTLKNIGSVPYSFTVTGPSNAALNSVERQLYFYGRGADGGSYFLSINVDDLTVTEYPFHQGYSTYPVTIAWAFSTTD